MKEQIEKIIKENLDLWYNRETGNLEVNFNGIAEQIINIWEDEYKWETMAKKIPTFNEYSLASHKLQEEYEKELPSDEGNYGYAFLEGGEWMLKRILGDDAYNLMIDNA